MNRTALIEAVYRTERARVLATTIRVTHGDFDLAEEVVQETFAAAVARWPVDGTPREPLAWLISVARNKAIDAIRRNIKLRDLLTLAGDPDAAAAVDDDPHAVPDDRLRLMFTCCHPALASEAQIALTLHTLGGLTTEEIARAFLVPPTTMGQRLLRAKNKIRTARIPYDMPPADQLAPRIEAVMEALYLIFNEGYAATTGDTWVRRDLCTEAIRLARLLVDLTRTASTQGLLALMLLHDSRRDARTDEHGDLVLLQEQDRSKWDRLQIAEALTLVPLALRGGADAYALQAAIAALHASAATAAETDWPQIIALFAELMRRAPSAIVALNQAVAVAMGRDLEEGLALLAPLEAELAGYHLWHAARADLLRRLNRKQEATAAYNNALRLVGSAPERRFLERRLQELSNR